MEKSITESNLGLICIRFKIDRAYRLSCTRFRKIVVIHVDPFVTDPVKYDLFLSGSDRASPMYKIILRHRHPVVKNYLLDLRKVYWREFSVHLEGFHERLDVISTVS